ncbi:MAG: hypothetical protein KJP07_19565 [Desulfatitalea sp.]|nr:hypothetical protein [Desulfatitalea sp.]
MLVGEHGRVIPFRHFKSFAIAVAGITLASIASLAVLAWLYVQQGRRIDDLQKEISESQQQAEKYKNDYEMLIASQAIKAAPTKIDTEKNTAVQPVETVDVKKQAPVETVSKTPPTAAKPPKPVPKQAPAPTKIQWRADIRNFDTAYNPARERLTTRFQIYNISVPKSPLVGRVVIVFKSNDDPPIKWMAVPYVPLTGGKPAGDTGKTFKISNYRTMVFTANQLKPPFAYDTITVFVYLTDGRLILARDFEFKVELPETQTPSSSSPAETPLESIATETAPEDQEPPASNGEKAANNSAKGVEPEVQAVEPSQTPDVRSDVPGTGPMLPAPGPKDEAATSDEMNSTPQPGAQSEGE